MAEACAVAGLRKLGFTIIPLGARSSAAALIEAWKVRQRVVVRVNTSVSPSKPQPLTIEAEQALRRRATRTGAQAWEAQVLLGSDLELVQLEWRPLE